jgi:hypothetical protein
LAVDGDSTLIKKDMTIHKDYIPSIQSAGKVDIIPSVVDPDLKKIDVDYSSYSTLIDPPYEIHSLEAARLSTPPLPERKDGLLRLGMGNYWSTIADLICPVINKPTFRWDITANHLGTFSDKMHHTNELGMDFHRYYTSGEFVTQFSYGYEGFNYYGDNKLSDNTLGYSLAGNTFTNKDFFSKDAAISTWNMAMGYKSIPNEDKERQFSLNFKYGGFSPNQGLKEHLITTQAAYEAKIDENKAGITFDMNNLIYSNVKVDYASSQKSYTVVSLNPYFDFDQEGWYLRIGAKLNFSGEGTAFAPAADIKTLVTLVDKTMYFYGGITGDLKENTMKEILAENRYINLNEKIKSTYTPFDIYGGLKLKLLYNFVTDFSISYKKVKDQYFFANDTVTDLALTQTRLANVFTANYSDASLLTTNLKINYNFNQVFSFLFAWKHNSWKVDNGEAWQTPKNEFDFGTDMKLTKRTTVNIYSYFATGREAMKADGSSESLKSIADINLGLFYAHSSKVSAFLKLNNLFHQKYDEWNGYQVNGFNVMFGLVFSF